MHTAKVIGTGFGLLALCMLVGRKTDKTHGIAKGASLFLPVWLIGSGINMYLRVKSAAYNVADELPVTLGIFSVPALAAAVVLGRWHWLLSQANLSHFAPPEPLCFPETQRARVNSLDAHGAVVPIAST